MLLRHFPHHVAITQSHVGNVLWEALGNYLGMDVYHADAGNAGAVYAAAAVLRALPISANRTCEPPTRRIERKLHGTSGLDHRLPAVLRALAAALPGG